MKSQNDQEGQNNHNSPKNEDNLPQIPENSGKIPPERSVPQTNPGPKRDERNHQHDYMSPVDRHSQGNKQNRKDSRQANKKVK